MIHHTVVLNSILLLYSEHTFENCRFIVQSKSHLVCIDPAARVPCTTLDVDRQRQVT